MDRGDGGLDFLNGGGEMGARMRALDWTGTGLGPPTAWPQSLKTIVRVMLDSRFAMWLYWGDEGIFFCNDAYLPTVGIKRDWVLGARSERVWQEIWHDVWPRIEHVLTTGKATWDDALQLFLRRRGYEEETFHTFSYSPVYDESNRVAGMLCVVVEDTDRVIGERRLKHLSRLAATPTAGATTVAAAGNLMLAAVAAGPHDIPFAALYLAEPGTDGATLVGSTQATRSGAPSFGSVVASAVRQALTTEQQQPIEQLPEEVELRGPWGEPLRAALVTPLKGAGHARPFGCLVVGISTRRQLDDGYRRFMMLVADQFASQLADVQSRLDAEKRAEALAELDRAKNLFFSNVSHELRTPLTLLLGPIDNLLARADLDPGVREDFLVAQRNAWRLRKLVNSLLDFSRIEAGRVETQFQATDLATFTADLASVFRSAVEDAGLRLVVRTEALTQLAYVDRDMWERVVLNLLSNAFKFTFEGRIEVLLEARDQQAVLTVRDTGIGMSPDALTKVFDRFHRVAGARSRSQEGTGIGLAMIKELVKLHGGAVVATSAVGEGTTFTVTVPLGRAHLPPDRVDDRLTDVTGSVERAVFLDEALRSDNSSFRRVAPAQMRKAESDARHNEHVHVVDDNADMRAYVQRLLEPHWRVTTSSDGAEALQNMAQDRPDLVITDMMMPRLDGRALIQRLRADPATEALPVIVLSAQAGEEARVAGLAQGADDYLVKPFSAPELLARVEVQLVRVRLRRAREILNRRLADIFRNAPVGVALLSGPRHIYEFVNPIYSSFVGGRKVEGLPIRDALPELTGQGIFELLDQVYAEGKPYRGNTFPVQMLDAAAAELQQRYFEFIYQPLSEESDRTTGIAVICVDVTDMMSARLAAEQANRTKDEFIAMLGHELRNPLAPISAALALMGKRAPETSVREREIIGRQLKHMVRLVDDMLDVSRITRGALELERSRIELASIVQRAVETVAPSIESKRQVLTVNVPAQGLMVFADAGRLVQVVANVLTNSFKFTPVGGGIAVSAERHGSRVELVVSDSGIGMTATELETVFGMFVQGRQDFHRPQGGLGLGLAIARSLVKLHDGTLTASSDGPGRGSRFTISLPLSDGTEQLADNVSDSLPPTSHRILLVDDNVDAAEPLAELLAEHGHDVVTAVDGPSALRLFADSDPPIEVAVLDIGLPGMNGYELARLLRERESAPRLIALSGYAQERDRQLAAASGFYAHLAKPVDIHDLLKLVEGDLPNRGSK